MECPASQGKRPLLIQIVLKGGAEFAAATIDEESVMRPAPFGFARTGNIKLQNGMRRQNLLPLIAVLTLLFCLVFGAYTAWKMVFYVSWQTGADIRDAFPLVYQPAMFIKMAATHPKLPFFLHGIAGTIAMLSGAIQFLLILRGSKTRWHALLGKAYAVSSIIASTTAISLAWSLHHDMLVTSLAYTAGAVGWCLATLIAVHTIMSGDLERHISWCIRSYACLAMVVTARLLLASGAVAGSGDWGFEAIKLQYAVTIVATFFINWALGEWIVAKVRDRRRNSPAARGRVTAACKTPIAPTFASANA